MNGNVRVCIKCISESRQCITGLVSSQANSFAQLASRLTQTIIAAYNGQTQRSGYRISGTSYKTLKQSASLLITMHPTSSVSLTPPPSIAIHIRPVPSTSHSLLSLSLPALTNPHHKFPLIYFLSPNQLPYKFKQRSKVTNFARSFSVTSVTLCPQAAELASLCLQKMG